MHKVFFTDLSMRGVIGLYDWKWKKPRAAFFSPSVGLNIARTPQGLN